MSSLVHTELNLLGKKLQQKMKLYALPNKKTGRLDKSILYETYSIRREMFMLKVHIMYYGKFLNAKTGFFDDAFNEIWSEDIDGLVKVQAKEIFEDVLNMDWGE